MLLLDFQRVAINQSLFCHNMSKRAFEPCSSASERPAKRVDIGPVNQLIGFDGFSNWNYRTGKQMLGLQIEHDTKDSTTILLVPVRDAQAGNAYCLYFQRSFYIELRDLNVIFAQLNSTTFFNIAQRLIDETIQQIDIRKVERTDPSYIIAATMVSSCAGDTICLLSLDDCRRVIESVVEACFDQRKLDRAIHGVAQIMNEQSNCENTTAPTISHLQQLDGFPASPSAPLDEPAYTHGITLVEAVSTEPTEAVQSLTISSEETDEILTSNSTTVAVQADATPEPSDLDPIGYNDTQLQPLIDPSQRQSIQRKGQQSIQAKRHKKDRRLDQKKRRLSMIVILKTFLPTPFHLATKAPTYANAFKPWAQQKTEPCLCPVGFCFLFPLKCSCVRSRSACEQCECECYRRIRVDKKCTQGCNDGNCVCNQMGLQCEDNERDQCKNCSCGLLCDRNFRGKKRARYRIGKSKITNAGMGAFALHKIKKNGFIGFYPGVVVPEKDLHRDVVGFDFAPGKATVNDRRSN